MLATEPRVHVKNNFYLKHMSCIVKSILSFLLISTQVIVAQNKDVIIPEANLITQDIPEIPASIKKSEELPFFKGSGGS